MSTELHILMWSVILALGHLTIASAASTKVRGIKWNLSPRDKTEPALTGFAGRADRAFQNFKETFPLFVAAVVINEFAARSTGQISPMSPIGAHLYFWARALYLPLYLAGIPVVRTLVWLVSLVGILLVLSSAVLGMT